MRVRNLVKVPKSVVRAEAWKPPPVQPRYCPIYSRKKPLATGWFWRSARLQDTEGREYVLYAQVRPARNNWSAWLLVPSGDDWSLVARFEKHANEGRHIHSDCHRAGLEAGPSLLSSLTRVPPAEHYHRCDPTWNRDSFWLAAARFFRVSEEGPLFQQGS